MSYESDNINLSKQIILRKVNSSSEERVVEENTQLALNKKMILNNSSFSIQEKNYEIGKLHFNAAEYSKNKINWNTLGINKGVRKKYSTGKRSTLFKD